LPADGVDPECNFGEHGTALRSVNKEIILYFSVRISLLANHLMKIDIGKLLRLLVYFQIYNSYRTGI
jgi:hypothetical protein